MSRVQRIAPQDMTGGQRALYAAITGGPRATGPQHFALTAEDGSLYGPFNAMLLSPGVGSALQQLGSTLRFETVLSPRVRELAILIVAARWDSEFERNSHEAVGRAIGLSDDELAAVRRGEIPKLDDPAEAAAIALVHAMASGDVDDDSWTTNVPVIGEAATFELSTLVGYYATLALQLRIFRV